MDDTIFYGMVPKADLVFGAGIVLLQMDKARFFHEGTRLALF
jgi:hypothetical protein